MAKYKTGYVRGENGAPDHVKAYDANGKEMSIEIPNNAQSISPTNPRGDSRNDVIERLLQMQKTNAIDTQRDNAISATRKANRDLHGLRKDPVKTAAIDARRRKARVGGPSDGMKNRNQESRNRTIEKNKNKKANRADRTLDREFEAIGQLERDIANMRKEAETRRAPTSTDPNQRVLQEGPPAPAPAATPAPAPIPPDNPLASLTQPTTAPVTVDRSIGASTSQGRPPIAPPSPTAPTHTMPDGSTMVGAQHGVQEGPKYNTPGEYIAAGLNPPRRQPYVPTPQQVAWDEMPEEAGRSAERRLEQYNRLNMEVGMDQRAEAQVAQEALAAQAEHDRMNRSYLGSVWDNMNQPRDPRIQGGTPGGISKEALYNAGHALETYVGNPLWELFGWGETSRDAWSGETTRLDNPQDATDRSWGRGRYEGTVDDSGDYQLLGMTGGPRVISGLGNAMRVTGTGPAATRNIPGAYTPPLPNPLQNFTYRSGGNQGFSTSGHPWRQVRRFDLKPGTEGAMRSRSAQDLLNWNADGSPIYGPNPRLLESAPW